MFSRISDGLINHTWRPCKGTSGRAVVVGEELLLEAFIHTKSQPAVVLHALPGTTITVETTTDVRNPAT